MVEEIPALLDSRPLRVLSLSGNPLSPASLDRFEELAGRGVEVEYLRRPPDPDGDVEDTFTTRPIPPQSDWRVLEPPFLRPGNGAVFSTPWDPTAT